LGDEPRFLLYKSNSNDPDRNVWPIFILPLGFRPPARNTRGADQALDRVHHLARAMVLLDASAIARNVGRHLVFPASRRAACSHSDLGICKPRILRFYTRARSHTRFWGRKHDGRWGQKTRYASRLIVDLNPWSKIWKSFGNSDRCKQVGPFILST
jgi:hypothetical protein